jgi:hypothetical protein
MQKSNIVAVSVSPGISRVDTVSRLMNADWSMSGTSFSWLGVLLYENILTLKYRKTDFNLGICSSHPYYT